MDANRDFVAQLRVSVEEALQSLKDPASGLGLIEARLASGLVVKDDGRVAFMVEVPPDRRDAGEDLRQKAEAAVAAVPGVTRVTAVLTAHGGGPSRFQVEQRQKGAAQGPHPAHGAANAPKGVRLNKEAMGAATPQPAQSLTLPPGVKAILAVSSAKGGVGKSTIAVNLAVAMARLGQRVGILDTDVYGPSVPRLLGLNGASPQKTKSGKISPPEAWGVRAMSIGFMVDDDAPLIWRGPIVSGALMQFLNDVDWAGAEAAGANPKNTGLDVLVLDMPPGTGDIQLTIVQRIPISGAVIVSTPQEIALADVRRGLAMFKKTAAPVLGIVENMAWFEDSNGAKTYVFGKGGAERTAKEAGVPFLGALPLIADIGTTSDSGQPIAATAPDSPAGKYFESLALKVLEGLEAGVGVKPPPKISFIG
ncbi:MAG: Mrp/NBP35 family ATP-binding protein [Caulobacterales bacterium]